MGETIVHAVPFRTSARWSWNTAMSACSRSTDQAALSSATF